VANAAGEGFTPLLPLELRARPRLRKLRGRQHVESDRARSGWSVLDRAKHGETGPGIPPVRGLAEGCQRLARAGQRAGQAEVRSGMRRLLAAIFCASRKVLRGMMSVSSYPGFD